MSPGCGGSVLPRRTDYRDQAMKDPNAFDEFYKETRGRLLLQTYALTGDLAASRAAVRDAFVTAWHHWRKLARLDDPETAVRPDAWRHAQRRHTARLWHKDKGIATEVKETFDVLDRLTMRQRKALLLTQVATVSLPQMAREIGLPLDEAERELQDAVAEFTRLRDVPTLGIRAALEPLEHAVAETRFPRATIIRRAGAARRRTHTTVGAIAAVAVFLVSGAVVTDAAGVRPSLDRSAAGASDGDRDEGPPPPPIPEDALVSAADLDAVFTDRTWREGLTDTGGSDDVLPCQRAAYADSNGSDALVRKYAGQAAQLPRAKATQMVEASSSEGDAKRTYRTLVAWFAGCADARTQLIATRRVAEVGDQAIQVVLRSWQRPVTTYVVGVARSGHFTTTTVDQVATEDRPDVVASSRMLAAAVEGLCGLEDGGGCASDKPTLTVTTPVRTGVAPALLSEVDLPPVTRVDKPWAGTEPADVTDNMAATRCEDASFTGRFGGVRFTQASTRTFVVPEADLPHEFGLTETVAALPRKQAAGFVAEVRKKLGSCATRDLGTDVTLGRHFDDHDRSLSVWYLRTELSDKRSLSYAMAILRSGTSVGQLSFVQAPGVTMPDGAFDSLAVRALDRLGALRQRH
jgi:DNA-directed RNA polymerase specialized sigma24 family protein